MVTKNKLIQRRPRADKTREIILKTATRLFAKNGFSGVSMREIAQAAKIHYVFKCRI